MAEVAFVLRGAPGLGHVTPAYAVAKYLESKGLENSAIVSYGIGVKFLRAADFKNIIEVPIPAGCGFPWLNMKELTVNILPIIRTLKPKLIVIDGEFDAPFLLKNLGYGTVILTTTPYIERQVGVYKRYDYYGEAVFGVPDSVFIHGLLRPDNMKDNMTFVGPVVQPIVENISESNSVPICTSSSTSSQFNRDSKRVARLIRRLGYDTVLLGPTKGSRFCAGLGNYFSAAPFIVGHGGMSTLEEAYLRNKQILVIESSDEEKDMNGKHAEMMGFGKYLRLKDADDNRLIKEIRTFLMTKPTGITVANGCFTVGNAILKMMNC